MIVRVLDDAYGEVALVDWMGDDARVVAAARVSHGAAASEARTPVADRALLRYLMAHEHTSPFEMCKLTVRVVAPLFVARQWMRHRTFAYNEVSGRYTELPERCYVPPAHQVCAQSASNRQGRAAVPMSAADAGVVMREIVEENGDAHQTYRRLAHGDDAALYDGVDANLLKPVARELARIVLPLSTYTEFYVTMDAHNLMRFLRLRLAPDAQWETRRYAQALAMLLHAWMPITYEAFRYYQVDGVRLSAGDVRTVRAWLAADGNAADDSEASGRERQRLRAIFGVSPSR